MKHTFEIPGWHPATLNRMDRSRGARIGLKRRDREQIARAKLAYDLPEATGKRRVSLLIVLGKGQRGCDPDAYWKSTLDALRAAKLLVDDRRQCVELGVVEYQPGVNPSTLITLEDLS